MIPIIAFGGASQTGKTTLGRRLAAYCQCKFVSFGDYVRQKAQNGGLSNPTREDLQNLGQKLVKSGVSRFCQEVLDTVQFSSGGRLVIDGIRHTEALSAISQISRGQPIKLIYLYAPMKIREVRSQQHDGSQALRAIDAHPVESQTVELRNSADFVLDASADLDTNFSQILEWLNLVCPELLTVGDTDACRNHAGSASSG